MEHFAVIQSLIRIGLVGDRDAFKQQVIRFRTRLEKAKDTDRVRTIDRLLRSASTAKELKPSRVELSRTLVRGERLTAETHPPIDRETGARLCTVDFGDTSFAAPILGKNVESTIRGLVEEWQNVAALEEIGIEPTRTLLIYGPPGSGKTMTARYVASRLDLPLVTARIDGLISSFLGKTARNIAHLFDFANRYACVLMLDEFDAIAKLRDDPHEVGEIKRVVNTLLQNLDLRRECGVTVAITNHDGLLDPAVWRRFETQIHIDKPDREALSALIARFLHPFETTPEIVRIFAYCLDGRSGADLERVCASVKRTMALSGAQKTPPDIFQALATVAARLPAHDDNTPISHLASGPKAFIRHIVNDSGLGMTQGAIARVTGYSQPQISLMKRNPKS